MEPWLITALCENNQAVIGWAKGAVTTAVSQTITYT